MLVPEPVVAAGGAAAAAVVGGAGGCCRGRGAHGGQGQGRWSSALHRLACRFAVFSKRLKRGWGPANSSGFRLRILCRE